MVQVRQQVLFPVLAPHGRIEPIEHQWQPTEE